MKRIVSYFFIFLQLLAVFTAKSQATTYPAEKERKLSKGNTTYFIDPVNGKDDHTGARSGNTWKTFDHINRLILAAGDKVEIISPGTFKESLVLIARGKSSAHVRIHFAPGVYNFYRDQAFKTKFNISNTNDTPDSLKAIALYIQSSAFTDIAGSGAKLVMHGKMIETCIDHSDHIRLAGMTYDYFRPTVSELRVLNTGTNFADLEINPHSWYTIRDSVLTWEGEGWHYQPIALWQVLDPKTGDLQRTDIDMNGIKYAETDKNRVRAWFTRNPGFTTGLIYQNRDITRDCTGIFLRRNNNIRLKNVRINFMHGMGIVSQFCENVEIDSLTVRPDPTSGLTCAAWADILHFSGCRGKIVVSHSYLSGANDDAVNVHGTYLRIVGSPRPDQLLVRFMHNQTFGFDAFIPGDSIALIHSETMLQYDSNVVVKVQEINDKDFLLTLKRPLTYSPGVKDVVENISWTPTVWIHHTIMTRIPTRGILVTTRKKVILENNSFEGTHLNGISIGGDAANWYESGAVRDLTIRKNNFLFCGEPVITISPDNTVQGDGYVHNNISITNNVFHLQSSHVLFAKSTSGIRISGNKFYLIDFSKKLTDLFLFRDCKAISQAGNHIMTRER